MKHTRAAVSAVAVTAVTAGLVTALGTSAPAATGFSTSTTWTWASATTPSTATTHQVGQATVAGLTDKDKNAAFVLRRTGTKDLFVNLSGTRYQVWTRNGGVWTAQVDKARAYDSSGVLRVEVSGTTLRTTLDGVLVDSRTVPAAATLTGTGTGVAVWQNLANAVRLSGITTTTPVTTPAPTTTTSTPTTTPTPTPTTTTSAPAPLSFSTTTTWDWAQTVTPSTPTAEQFAQATVAGLTDADKNAAFALRRNGTTDVLVNLSGTRYQVWTRNGTAWTDEVDVARPAVASGLLRVEVSGSTVTTRLGGVLVDSRSIPDVGALAGTGTAAAVWQNVSGAVTLTGITTGSLSSSTSTTGPAPTTTSPVPTTTSPTPTPTQTTTQPATSTGFVTRSGTGLVLAGRPFRFVGYDAVHMLGCTTSDRAVTDIEGYFAGPGRGMTDRVWTLPGADLSLVDRIVRAAKANGSHVYLVLSDANGACGDPGGAKSSSWYTGGWRATHEAWFRTMATRYRNETAIAFWELVNESGGDGNAVKAFNTDASALLKSLDPNHLVESGTMPDYAFGGPAGWTAANSAPGVDITSVHEYDQDQVASGWLVADQKLSLALGKPIVVGEFGIEASQTGGGTQPLHGGACRFTYTSRASRAQAKLDAYLSTPGVVGADYWAFSGKSRTGSDCDTETGPNDTALQAVFTAKAATLR